LNLKAIELKVRTDNKTEVKLYNHLGFKYVNNGETDDRGFATMELINENYKPGSSSDSTHLKVEQSE